MTFFVVRSPPSEVSSWSALERDIPRVLFSTGMHYRETDAWQKAMDLVDAVYDAVDSFPASETFLLSKQMRSAATSIASNIAEGSGRWSTRDYRHFAVQARGSAYELETQVLIAQRRKFITETQATAVLKLTGQVCQLVNGLIRYLDAHPFDDAR